MPYGASRDSQSFIKHLKHHFQLFCETRSDIFSFQDSVWARQRPQADMHGQVCPQLWRMMMLFINLVSLNQGTGEIGAYLYLFLLDPCNCYPYFMFWGNCLLKFCKHAHMCIEGHFGGSAPFFVSLYTEIVVYVPQISYTFMIYTWTLRHHLVHCLYIHIF